MHQTTLEQDEYFKKTKTEKNCSLHVPPEHSQKQKEFSAQSKRSFGTTIHTEIHGLLSLICKQHNFTG